MFFGALIISSVVPFSLTLSQPLELALKPYIVQAVIDAAQIAGLPCSRAAKAYAQNKQAPDPIIQQISFTPDPVSARRLFFREYFRGI